MDYPHQARLKIIGHARIVELGEDPALEAKLQQPAYPAKIERIFVISVVGLRLELLPAHYAALHGRRIRRRGI